MLTVNQQEVCVRKKFVLLKFTLISKETEMNIAKIFMYKKKRKDFGQRFNFRDKNEVIFDVGTNKKLTQNFILKNPVHQSTQMGVTTSVNVVNTDNKVYSVHGVTHTEGGWPKDINSSDPEQMFRYKKKLLKDDSTVEQIIELTKPMLRCINQNSAMDIYGHYFTGLETIGLPANYSGRTVNRFNDPLTTTRPLTHLSWSAEGGHNIVASYCDYDYGGCKSDTTSLVWNIGIR